MKKFLLLLLVLIIALVVASQFLLPSFIGSRITEVTSARSRNYGAV